MLTYFVVALCVHNVADADITFACQMETLPVAATAVSQIVF